MNIRESLEAEAQVYYSSKDEDELSAAAKTVEGILNNPAINENNKQNGEALLIKLVLKVRALRYFCGGYDGADLDKLLAYAKTAAEVARESGYKNSLALCESVSAAASAINGVMCDAYALKCRICDDDDNCTASSYDECVEVSAEFSRKIAQTAALEFDGNVFGKADFGDVKEMAQSDLEYVKNLADKFAKKLKSADIERIIRESSEDVTEIRNSPREYFPRNDSVQRSAKALVVCTPFKEELELFVAQYSQGNCILAVQALSFENRPRDEVDEIFSAFAERGADIIIYGLARFRGENEDDLYRALMRFGKSGRFAFIWDNNGARPLYNRALKATGDGVTNLDISFLYLGMPDYKDVIDQFESAGMISGEDYEDIKKRLPFMGFVGLNEAFAAYAAQVDKKFRRWFEVAADYSSRHINAAAEFMKGLANQSLFLDGGWGEYCRSASVTGKKAFDYDDIKCSNPANIRKIMQGDFSIFQKCGLISRYCTLHNQDVSVWADLGCEERSERLTEATRLVMRALDVDLTPTVEVRDSLGDTAAGGQCCDGGKLILYKTSCVNNYDWTVKCICHECYHAFQHKTCCEAYRDWFWSELGVTRGRIDKWSYNFKYYKDIGKVNREGSPYMLQVVECDARAFEDDCFDSSNEVINTINFE